VTPSTLVLLHSPLTGAAAWGDLPEQLASDGRPVVVVEVTTDTAPPYAVRYVAAAAQQAAAGALDPGQPLVLVGHSGAGPLLPQVGFALRAARRRIDGYVFCDAGLPRPGGAVSRLDLMETESAQTAPELRLALEAGGQFPAWTDADLRDEVPDAGDRAMLLASLRPRRLDFFVEPLPAPQDWPDAPCGVLQTSAAYDQPARLADGRRWPVVRRDLGHFAALTDPVATAQALRELLAAL
jgi:Alpha/beta hydrolase family